MEATEKYVVIEMQTNADGTLGNLVSSFDDRNQAESAFHGVLASAAISTLPVHTALLVTNTGLVLNAQRYEHEETANAG